LERFDQTKPVGFLAKPFTHSILKTRLQSLLGETRKSVRMN